MISIVELLERLYRETINLSDDERIMQSDAFKKIEAMGKNALGALAADYNKRKTRAVMLLLDKIGV